MISYGSAPDASVDSRGLCRAGIPAGRSESRQVGSRIERGQHCNPIVGLHVEGIE